MKRWVCLFCVAIATSVSAEPSLLDAQPVQRPDEPLEVLIVRAQRDRAPAGVPVELPSAVAHFRNRPPAVVAPPQAPLTSARVERYEIGREWRR